MLVSDLCNAMKKIKRWTKIISVLLRTMCAAESGQLSLEKECSLYNTVFYSKKIKKTQKNIKHSFNSKKSFVQIFQNGKTVEVMQKTSIIFQIKIIFVAIFF